MAPTRRSGLRSRREQRRSRELDNVVLERATFVCCDWKEQARLESADLIEPIEQGVLDWLEVHELHEVVSGELPGRQSPDDIALFKSNGIAAWDVAIAAAAVERARERGVGTRALAGARGFEIAPRVLDRLVTEGLDQLGAVEHAQPLLRAEPVLHVPVLQDLLSARPRPCSRMTYATTRSSMLDRAKRKEKGERSRPASRCIGRLYPCA